METGADNERARRIMKEGKDGYLQSTNCLDYINRNFEEENTAYIMHKMCSNQCRFIK